MQAGNTSHPRAVSIHTKHLMLQGRSYNAACGQIHVKTTSPGIADVKRCNRSLSVRNFS